MKETRIYQLLETIGTITWFTMDFCWMSKYKDAAWIISSFSAGALCLSIISCMLDGRCRNSERLISISSLMWFMMNAFWMFGEDTNMPSCLTAAKITFLMAAVLVIITIFVARKEKEQIDFKRLKIK